jgi:hypothetical protein
MDAAEGGGTPAGPDFDHSHITGSVVIPPGTMVKPPSPQMGVMVFPGAGAGAWPPPDAGVAIPPLGTMVQPPPQRQDASVQVPPGVAVCPPNICHIPDGGADD